MNLTAVHQSMKLYKNAMEEYTIAMESAPNDHRLYSNRALCYLAVEEWEKAKGDSLYCARLRPDFKKAWLLLTKSLWKMGCMEEANEQLQQGLRHLPGCPELLELQVDFGREIADASFRQASRSVSPAYTPTPSRQQTPTPSRHTHRPGLTVEIQDQATDLSVRGSWLLEVLPLSLGLLPLLLPRMLAHRRGRRDLLRIVVARATYPLWMPVSKREISGLLHPCSQLARCPPSHEAMAQSFPASAHTMWAGNSNQRSSYSPGPANAGSTRTTSHSPGPNLSSTAGHDLGASARMPQDRKSASLRGMLESSSRSRGPTPPSRNATPPRR